MSVSRVLPIVKGLGASALILFLAACSGSGSSTTTTSTPAAPTVANFTGSYVFTAAGTDSTDGDYVVTGTILADGKGNITSGIADYNLGSGIDSSVPLTGTYTVSGSSVSVKLTDSGSVQDSFTASLITSGSTALSAFDGNGTGTLYAQASGFTVPGSYNYTLQGEGQGVITGSGQFVVNAAENITSGTMTFTDGSNTVNYASIGGILDSPDTNGRGLGVLNGNTFAYYPLGAKAILLVGLDDRDLLMATAQKQ